jgi:hypothetical protein
MRLPGDLGVGGAPVALQKSQNSDVDPVEAWQDGRLFHDLIVG